MGVPRLASSRQRELAPLVCPSIQEVQVLKHVHLCMPGRAGTPSGSNCRMSVQHGCAATGQLTPA